ncbi:hypothetical protein J8J40_33910, partial [Mycobacterium tuberculosis]|nr:hypothetical protein [Mycobacterium tuberculosis]
MVASFAGRRPGRRSSTPSRAHATDNALAEAAATRLIDTRHGRRDFFVLNTDDIRQTITATTQT